MAADTVQVVRRLWRPRTVAGIAVPLALAIVVNRLRGSDNSGSLKNLLDAHKLGYLTVPLDFALVIVAALLAAYAARTFVVALNAFLDDYLGLARARSLATLTSVVLYAIIVLWVVGAVGQNLQGVLVGGALTGVIVGIAGQASLSNIVAGLVILFARPYSAGMYVTARTGTFGGVEYSGQVWDISLFYTTLHAAGDLEVRIPNSAMINAVVVSRPQQYEVSIPVTLPKATEDVPAVLDRLRAAVAGCTRDAAALRVTLDSVTDLGYVAGVRAFVPDDAGRRAVEDAVARVVAGVVATVAAEAEAVDTEDAGDAVEVGSIGVGDGTPGDGGRGNRDSGDMGSTPRRPTATEGRIPSAARSPAR